MNTEQKTLTFSVKAVGTRTDAETGQEFGQIEALGAVFDNVDEDRDRIRPGAFTRTIKNSKERAGTRGKKYLAPMLWQHDTHELIGGWYDLSETPDGLLGKGDISLATQRGREYYALAKAGMADQFSIIYDIPAGGATYTKSGVRDLTELRLFSIDPVTFAANDATALVAVKAAETAAKAEGASTVATVIGNTSGPLGPRDEAWDGGKAENQIWAAAYDDESGEIDTALAKKYFMLLDGDPQKKGSYGLPFWYVGSDPHISVGAVKAIAGAVQGSRGATTTYPDGVKTKVETLYKRINAKYPDDPQLTAPWASESSKTRRGTGMQKKTFQEHYQEEQCEDLLEDWCEVVLCAFTSAVYDAFAIGDAPESDVNDALDGLKTAVAEWVAEAVKYNLSEYIDDLGDMGDYNPGLSRMQNGAYKPYGWMSRDERAMRQKAMMAGDATTGGFTADHVEKMRGAASKAMKGVEKHASALHDMAASVKELVGPSSNGGGEKAGRAFSAANAKALSDHADALDDAADAHSRAMTRQMKAITSVADDLATVLQGSESAYGTDPGNAGDHQEGKQSSHHRTPSSGYTRLARTPHNTPPSAKSADTVSEEEAAAALLKLRKLRTPA